MEVERTPGQSIPGCFRKGTNYPLPGRFFLPPVRQPVDFVTSFFRFQPPAEDGNCQVSREYAYFSALRGFEPLRLETASSIIIRVGGGGGGEEKIKIHARGFPPEPYTPTFLQRRLTTSSPVSMLFCFSVLGTRSYDQLKLIVRWNVIWRKERGRDVEK